MSRAFKAIEQQSLAATRQGAIGSCDDVREAVRRAQEQDRARVAQAIHDHFGFLLMLLRMRLQLAKSHVARLSSDRGQAVSNDEALAAINDAVSLLNQLSDAARELQNDLHPAPLDNHGLAAALAALQVTFAGAGLRIDLRADALTHKRFSPKLETTAYWITQHALTNVLRHSGTKEATVTAEIVEGPVGETLNIIIQDWGKGFVVGEIGASFGLTAMYDRAVLIGGAVVIDSGPGQGTRVTANLPVDFEPSSKRMKGV